MRLVYFNDTHPYNCGVHDLIVAFEACLLHYRTLKYEHRNYIDGIITSALPHDVIVNNDGLKLTDILSQLSREYRTYAYSLFTKYPVDKFIDLEEGQIDNIIINNFILQVQGIEGNATSLYMAYSGGCIAMSLGVHPEYLEDRLQIIERPEEIIHPTDNLFGTNLNTSYLRDRLLEYANASSDNLTLFQQLLNEPVIEKLAEKQFAALHTGLQERIIGRFQGAVNKGLLFPIRPDNDLIKDVTPDNESDCNVYELRIFQPKAIRVYFGVIEGQIIVCSIEPKPQKRVQDRNIQTAMITLKGRS